MQITSITYNRGATINTGNFNSVRVDISATAEVPEGEAPDDAMERLKDFVEDKVRAEVGRHAR